MQGIVGSSRSLLVAFLLSCVSFVLANDCEPKDDQALDGTWQVDVSETQAIQLSIRGADIAMTAVVGEERLPIWVGKLRRSNDELHQHMDWIELRSGDARLPDNKCLFRLRGDVLLVIGGGPDKRPTKFLSGPGSDPKTLVFIRKSPK